MKVAILIAVEKYAHANMKPVEFAAADASGLARVLEPHGFSESDRVLLVNDHATKSRIDTHVNGVLKWLTANDELLFFYVGRGFSRNGIHYLTCHDTDPNSLIDTSIALNGLVARIQQSHCGKIALFLDLREIGLPASGKELDLRPSVSESGFESLFTPGELTMLFGACRKGETPHASKILKHGIWTYHITEAFAGRAPTALVNGKFLTPGSLQNYLLREVPRTLTQTFATKKLQTPWMVSAPNGDVHLADLTDILASKETAPVGTRPVKNVALLSQRTREVRGLLGFEKGHKLPDRVNSYSQAFIAKVASHEITANVDRVFGRLRNAFGFKRADLQVTNRGDGSATIITPYFNYSITVELDPQDPSRAIFRQMVDAIKEPEPIFSDAFAEAFENVFDTVRFDTSTPVDLAALIDRLEALNDARVTLDYDPGVTYCSLRVRGVAAAITVTSSSLCIVDAKPKSSKSLLQSFFGLQETIFDGHDLPDGFPW